MPIKWPRYEVLPGSPTGVYAWHVWDHVDRRAIYMSDSKMECEEMAERCNELAYPPMALYPP